MKIRFRSRQLPLVPLILCVLFALGSRPLSHGAVSTPFFTWNGISTNGYTNLDTFLESHRDKLKLPALAAVVVSKEKLLAAGVVGLRKLDAETPVTLNDKFHIGSITKSMTALLTSTYIKEAKLRSNTTVGDVFPGWDLSDTARKITLRQLLTHRSGLPYKPSDELWNKAWFKLQGPPFARRETYLREALMEPLEAEPGEKYIYSNTGFALVGAMLETIAKEPWEELIQERVFKPIGFTEAGFGPPQSPDKVDQPWGHSWEDDKIVVASRTDNPVVIAPAGTVHCSILDLARYVAFQLNAIDGKIPEIDETLRAFLYTASEGETYAPGWMVVKRGWAGGRALTHNGTNTTYFTLIWLAPEKDIAFVVCTNVGDKNGHDTTFKACDQVIAALIGQFVK